jgi:hypothetical protein
MIRLALSILFVMVSSSAVFANWRAYREDKSVIASFDYLSFESFHNQPSVWVKWHYVIPRKGVAGIKLQFTANCPEHRLFEIAAYPFDADGRYLKPKKSYDSPKEYPITPGSLNEATYKLLCH